MVDQKGLFLPHHVEHLPNEWMFLLLDVLSLSLSLNIHTHPFLSLVTLILSL